MAKVKGGILVEIDKCKGCELCIAACPQKTIELSDKLNAKGYHFAVTTQNNCTGCTNCALVCPEGIIKVFRKVVSKDDIASVINNTVKP